MSFRDFPTLANGVQLLQRSLERGRLAHGYLFFGDQLDELEPVARTLAKTLNCAQPIRKGDAAIDCCDQCLPCRKIDHENHPDIHWARPESKLRFIAVDQIRELRREMQLKPAEAQYKVAIIAGADRLKTEAANAFLKTLEEPAPNSVLILLSTEPQRVLETIVSRCLRLNLSAGGHRPLAPALAAWLQSFSERAAVEQKSLLSRYLLLDALLQKLGAMKEEIATTLGERSPLERYPDAEKDLREQWEAELDASIEAEYRRQRSEVLTAFQWWLRDVWLQTLACLSSERKDELLRFPEMSGTAQVATRISPAEALANLDTIAQLQRRLFTNVQEALALEVGLLKLKL